jgi:two-component system sensor kinase FixL
VIEYPALDQLPIALLRSAADGTVTWVNRLCEETIGCLPGGRWYAPFDDVDPLRARTLWSDCVGQQAPITLDASVRVTNDETRFFHAILQPTEVDGESEMMICLIDITDQTVALAETRAILDAAVDAIVIIDERGRIETFNQAAADLFGYEPDQVIGKSVNLLMTEEHARHHDGYLRHYLETGHASIIGVGRELTAQHANGDQIPIYLAVSDIHLDGRRRFAGIVRNLTEQHAAREALVTQREKLAHVGRLSTMGEMTASIAHEINQPLTAISMYAQASLKLLDQPDGKARVRDALEKLTVQSLRAGAVIERIQRFVRTQETSKELVEINGLVIDLLKLADSDARMHNIELKLKLADDLPAVFADPVQIQQVILNLIRNGIDAMNEIGCRNGRTIQLETRVSGGRVMVLVGDQGPGVADDQVDLVFTPFHTTKKEGMGMGLSICRSIIADHGGELSYRNNEGAGACFYFSLPVDDE